MLKISKYLLLPICLVVSQLAIADIVVPLYATAKSGHGNEIGSVTVTNSKYGLIFTPDLKGLTPGPHGFHIHMTPSCDDNGMAAGGHFDPANTGKHLGPYNDDGHLGDLPVMYINADGTATTPLLAPRLTDLNKIKNHALMIHEGGDNYSDTPAKLGGGGARMYCGVIQS